MKYRIVKHLTPEVNDEDREERFRVMYRDDNGVLNFAGAEEGHEPHTFGSLEAAEDAIKHWLAKLDNDRIDSWNTAENWEFVKEISDEE